MSNILNTIAEYTAERYKKITALKPLEIIKKEALSLPAGNFEFEKALKKEELSFICEVKKASPSKGIIAKDFPYLKIALEYEKAGASCISCLTEPKWFLGSDEYLREISQKVSIPVLRKDFTISEYQIYESKLLGASAVLLICALLDEKTIEKYIKICDSLGISALVEAHNEAEIKSAVSAGARIIGVNNRNLKDFSVDVNNSSKYRKLIPENVIFVSESGISSHRDIEALAENKTDAVLIGETLMKAENKSKMLAELKYGCSGKTKIKFCGLRRVQDIDYANRLMPDFIGFILSPGYRRSIDEKTAAALKERLAKGIKTVGVFVNDDISKINYFAESGIIDLVQLHGDESPSCCEKINAPVIKAFKCNEEISQKIKEYDTAFFLFDSGTGSGKAFDWKNIPKTNKPFFLAGGISEQNSAAAVKNIRPYAVDISTSVETNGFKDYYKMKKLTEMIRYE